MSWHPICEFVEVEPGAAQLTIAIRLRGADVEEGTTAALALRSRRGRVVARAHAEVGLRVSTHGQWTRSAVRFALDTAEIPAGGFRIEIAPVAAGGTAGTSESERWWPAEPSTGLLAGSRRFLLDGRTAQVVPAAGRPATWLRVASRGSGGWHRVAWALRNATRDVAFLAHGRRFSWVRLARLMTRPFAPSGPIWLLGERPETARDNGRALFAHLRRERPDAAVYYVLTADSPMRAELDQLGQVVTHSSWRHRMLMLHADVLANAYSIKHMLPARWHPGAYMRQAGWRLEAHRVYLKHGVHLSPFALKRANGGYHLLATVGSGETEALAETSGYASQLRGTGLARYDALVPPPEDERGRTVLFMPTWRRYLVPTLFGGGKDDADVVPYEGSAYQRFIGDFLGSQRLAEVLERHDLRLQVIPHYNLAQVLTLDRTVSDRIEVADARTADIPAALRSARMLVTDFSSVQFDVAYLGSPVVYCLFDESDYIGSHGAYSWFQPRRDGFGPVTATADQAIDQIACYAASDFRREPDYDERLATVFAHRDRENCDRLVRSIDELTRDG